MSACAGVEGSEKKQVKDPVREKGGYCILYLCFWCGAVCLFRRPLEKRLGGWLGRFGWPRSRAIPLSTQNRNPNSTLQTDHAPCTAREAHEEEPERSLAHNGGSNNQRGSGEELSR